MLSPQYLAGFFDGEGSVGCYVSKQHSCTTVTCELQIGNTHQEILEMIRDEHGGFLDLQSHPSRLGKHKFWLWRLTGPRTETFARLIEPYSVLKQEQLRLFLELRATVNQFKTTPEVQRRRVEIVAAIRAAKRSHLVRLA